jgi:hypothetical protein
MKTLTIIAVSLFLLCGAAMAADITGKYVAETKFTPPNGGEARIIKITFDLKSAGDAITGTVTGGGMRGGGGGAAPAEPPPANPIKDGKLDGNKFTFKVTSQGRNGEVITVYAGTVEGDTLKGTSVREGGQGEPRPFEAKKQ